MTVIIIQKFRNKNIITKRLGHLVSAWYFGLGMAISALAWSFQPGHGRIKNRFGLGMVGLIIYRVPHRAQKGHRDP